MLDALQGYSKFSHLMLTCGLKSYGNKLIDCLDHGFTIQYCRSIGVFDKNAFLQNLGPLTGHLKTGSDHHNRPSCSSISKIPTRNFSRQIYFEILSPTA